MPTPVILKVGELELAAELNDSATAKALAAALPVKVRMSRWGDEYYGDLGRPLGVKESPDAREEMIVGEMAYWPPGNALCVFFGPTPASTGPEPVAASKVNPIGKVTADATALTRLGRSVEMTVSPAPPAKR
jgi:hypothetical protein